VTQGTGRALVKTSAPILFARRFSASSSPASGRNAPDAGQLQDFRQTILPHLDGAYNLARFLTRDPVLSEDVVQDSVLRAFRAFGQFRGGSPRAWLFAIVRNCCRTALSGAGGAVSLMIHENSLSENAAAQLDQQPDPGLTPEEELFRKSEINRVRAAIEAIPEPFREAIVLRDFEDLSYAEVAQVTGVPVGTVMSRLSRGRAMLAKELLPSSKSGGEQARSVK
jgi:RNA polymerase sigma factor (sigma-70 family)